MRMWLLAAFLMLFATTATAWAQPVGLRRIEFFDPAGHGRHLAVTMVYPAALPAPAPKPMPTPFYEHLTLYRDAPFAAATARRPLVMFSHGRGGNATVYLWFAQALAAHGYIVAALDHYHANAYDLRIGWVASRIWQRPRDISLVLTDLLHDKEWGPRIDPARIGVAGHSQGGFTALWVAGARIDGAKFEKYQRGWKNNPAIPAHIRATMPVDATPALHVHDPRIKAAFAMAPGIIQAFGMDPSGLAHLHVPAYLIVGAGDTQTPAGPNAAYAAKYIPGAVLRILPGRVGHEVFTNECDQEGRDEFPEGCIDAPGIDRTKLHAEIAAEAVAFFDRALGPQARP